MTRKATISPKPWRRNSASRFPWRGAIAKSAVIGAMPSIPRQVGNMDSAGKTFLKTVKPELYMKQREQKWEIKRPIITHVDHGIGEKHKHKPHLFAENPGNRPINAADRH